jgi:hypothetical protein
VFGYQGRFYIGENSVSTTTDRRRASTGAKPAELGVIEFIEHGAPTFRLASVVAK